MKGNRLLATWMVVEDEPGIYDVLLAMFGIWGIDGVAFVDGEEAVAWIDDVDNQRFQGELPELAIIDIRLPGDIEGPEVGARLRLSPVLGDAAIVLITAYRLNAEEEKAVKEQAGADSLIYKPLPNFAELRGMLEAVINARRALKEKAGSSASQGDPPPVPVVAPPPVRRKSIAKTNIADKPAARRKRTANSKSKRDRDND